MLYCHLYKYHLHRGVGQPVHVRAPLHQPWRGYSEQSNRRLLILSVEGFRLRSFDAYISFDTLGVSCKSVDPNNHIQETENRKTICSTSDVVEMHSPVDIAGSLSITTWLLAGAIVVRTIIALEFRRQGLTDIHVTGQLVCFMSQFLPIILPSPGQLSWPEDSSRVERLVCVSMVSNVCILW